MRRRLFYWTGSALALIGVVFVGLRLQSHIVVLDFTRFTLSKWSYIGVYSLIYGSANLMLALAWWHLLQYFDIFPKRLGSIKIYGISQLAKYVPGNIFHLAGRQVLGMAAGIPARVLAKSTFWELGLLAIAASSISWPIVSLLFPYFPESVSIFLLLFTVIILGFIFKKFFSIDLMWSFFWQIIFFVVSASLPIALLYLISGSENLTIGQWIPIGCAFIAGWLGGFVTPGAPAGVGVREMILLVLLKGIVIELDLLIVVLLWRIVTVVGDLLFYIATSMISAKFTILEKTHV